MPPRNAGNVMFGNRDQQCLGRKPALVDLHLKPSGHLYTFQKLKTGLRGDFSDLFSEDRHNEHMNATC